MHKMEDEFFFLLTPHDVKVLCMVLNEEDTQTTSKIAASASASAAQTFVYSLHRKVWLIQTMAILIEWFSGSIKRPQIGVNHEKSSFTKASGTFK